MHRTSTVTAYDLLDTIIITAAVKDWDGTTVPPSNYTEFSCATTIPGEGQDDPVQWLKDALIGLIEAL